MRWIISGVLVVVCTAIGIQTGNIYTARRKLISQLLYALAVLDGEIAYSMTPLKRAFIHICETGKGAVARMFGNCAQQMGTGSRPFRELWMEQVEQLHSHAPLMEEEMEVLMELGNCLGRNDQENQQKALEQARARLLQLETEAREAEKKYTVLHRSLGLIGGLFLAVMLL